MKIYLSGGGGLVVFTPGMMKGTVRMGWFLQFSINCKNS